MNELGKGDIAEIIAKHDIKARKSTILEEISQSTMIRGCEFSRKLTDLYREVIYAVLQAIDLPNGVTVALTGSMARKHQTPLSDFDLRCFVPERSERFEQFARAYRPVLMSLFGQIGIQGDPVVWGPDNFITNRADQIRISSMCNEMDPLIERGITVDEIRSQTRSACPAIYVASRHEKELGKLRADRNALDRVEFNLKSGPGGLRNLQRILWFLLAFSEKRSDKLYAEMFQEHPQIFTALDVLLHLRAFLYVQKKHLNVNTDLLTGKDWPVLRERFGSGENDIMLLLHRSRVAIANLAQTELHKAKKRGIIVNDIRYGVSGLTMSMANMNTARIIQLLIEVQKTGLPISPSAIDFLEREGKSYLQQPHPKKGDLFLEPGNFSGTIKTLDQLDVAEGFVPGLGGMFVAQFEDEEYRHSELNKAGRAIARNACFEDIIENNPRISAIAGMLRQDDSAGICLALTCMDIPIPNRVMSKPAEKPRHMDAYRGYFYGEILPRYPQLRGAIEVALYCLEKHKILFECAIIDDWNEETELVRIAREVGTLEQLHTLLVYTCAVLDYGREDLFSRFQWRKMFGLYSALEDHLTEGHKIDRRIFEYSISMDPRFKPLLNRMPSSLHHSERINDAEQYNKTLRFLNRVQTTGNPSITTKRIDKNALQLIVSAVDNAHLPAILAQACFQNGASIDDAEIYPLPVTGDAHQEEKPLVIAFFEVHIGNTDVAELDVITGQQRIESQLPTTILANAIPQIDAKKICSNAQASYTLEPTPSTGKYKLIVTAKKDTPGFLLAITTVIAQAGGKISRMGVSTLPRKNESKSPIVRDIFILETTHIEDVRVRLDGVMVTKN